MESMTDTEIARSRSKRWRTPAIAAMVILGLLSTAGVAAAAAGFMVKGEGPGNAMLRCGGGMSRLGHVLNEDASVFPGDPAPIITVLDFGDFVIEEITIGTHLSTHLDAPIHFARGRSVDQLAAEELVWPAYVVDVTDRMTAPTTEDFQLTVDDLEAYEKEHGKIPEGAMVVLRTGYDEYFGTDDFVDYDTNLAPGFSGDAVQWMFDERGIAGTGSDTLGPDATSDDFFSATDTTLLNDGVALPVLNNVASLNITGDIIIASPVALENGSSFQVDPLACHGR